MWNRQFVGPVDTKRSRPGRVRRLIELAAPTVIGGTVPCLNAGTTKVARRHAHPSGGTQWICRGATVRWQRRGRNGRATSSVGSDSADRLRDRKSTRLNSSHLGNSYAV